jgi:molecular chaperone Hsp33
MAGAPFAARVVRALTADRRIRLSAVDATPLWDGVGRGHPRLEAGGRAALVELLAGAALMQSRSLLSERVQLLLRSSGRAGSIVADSWPDGGLRGIVDIRPGRDGSPWIERPGLFQVMRSNKGGPPYTGNLELAEGPVGAQLELYLQQSEQLQACVDIWCDPSSGDAGGIIVEPLPKCPPERLRRMLAALDGLGATHPRERTPDFLVGWVNQGGGADILSSLELEYRCRCSQQSLVDTLRAMPPEQRRDIFSGTDQMDVHCEYCGAHYSIAPEDLSGAERCGGGCEGGDAT